LQAQTLKDGETPSFHMASYLLDVIYARNIFVGMNIIWNVDQLLVHVYSKILWENRYKRLYSLIYDEFIARVYFIIFRKECLRLTTTTKKMVSKVGHWYFEKNNTYIRVFRDNGTPQLLPIHVSDRLIAGEICYQTILQGYNATLVKQEKISFIPYGFHIGFYMVQDTAHVKQEGLSHLEYRFPIGKFCKHDSKGLVLHNPSHLSSYWTYAHDSFEDEIFTEGVQD
jgi:hypothetical protein